jgi:hypothetical protein
MTDAELAATRITPGLVRLAVVLANPQDLSPTWRRR